MFEKTKKATEALEGELKGTMYPLEGMTKETEKKLIEDHFLFKDDDRYCVNTTSRVVIEYVFYTALLFMLIGKRNV